MISRISIRWVYRLFYNYIMFIHDIHCCSIRRKTFAVRETASLGIMGAPRVPPLNPSESIVLWEHYRLWGVWGTKQCSVPALLGSFTSRTQQLIGRIYQWLPSRVITRVLLLNISTHVFAFTLSIKIHSSMKIHI